MPPRRVLFASNKPKIIVTWAPGMPPAARLPKEQQDPKVATDNAKAGLAKWSTPAGSFFGVTNVRFMALVLESVLPPTAADFDDPAVHDTDVKMDIDSPNQLPVLHVRLKSQLHVGPNAVTRDGLIKDVDERVVVKTFPAGQRAFALDEARLITLAECGDLVPAILGIFYHGDNDSETHVVFKWCGTAPKTFCDLPLTDKLLIKNAFEKLHEEGIWHGDVEPRNVVKDAATGKWTVVDFGEATTHICEGPTCSELVQLEKDLSF